jgi:hypothetical protein
MRTTMALSLLGKDVDHVEYNGSRFTGDGATLMLDGLTEEERGAVVVVFKNGTRTSFDKVMASQGEDAVRVDGDKVYI